MEKINFINNSLPALNATNLNKLQDNIENAIQEVQDDVDNLDTNKLDKSSVKTVYTEGEADVYDCDYINGLQTYSTTEKRIGTWKDGKPLYRQVITETNITYGSATTINISSVYTIRKFEGYYERTNSRLDKFDNSTNLSLAIRSGNLEYLIGNNYQSGKIGMTIIIEYTKTTD